MTERSRKAMKGSIIATNLKYPLQITTRNEQVIVDVQEIYFDAGVPVISGTSQLTKRRRKFSAAAITHLRDMRTSEASVNAQSFLQALGKRLAEVEEQVVPAVAPAVAAASMVDRAHGGRASSPCYNCRRSVPRDELVRQRVLRGNRGRRHAGYVLMMGWTTPLS